MKFKLKTLFFIGIIASVCLVGGSANSGILKLSPPRSLSSLISRQFLGSNSFTGDRYRIGLAVESVLKNSAVLYSAGISGGITSSGGIIDYSDWSAIKVDQFTIAELAGQLRLGIDIPYTKEGSYSLAASNTFLSSTLRSLINMGYIEEADGGALNNAILGINLISSMPDWITRIIYYDGRYLEAHQLEGLLLFFKYLSENIPEILSLGTRLVNINDSIRDIARGRSTPYLAPEHAELLRGKLLEARDKLRFALAVAYKSDQTKNPGIKIDGYVELVEYLLKIEDSLGTVDIVTRGAILNNPFMFLDSISSKTAAGRLLIKIGSVDDIYF